VVNLKEVFVDFDVVLMSGSNFNRYRYPARIVKKENPIRVTLQDIVDYVETLKVKFPDKNFKLMKRRVEGKLYYIVTKKSY